MIYINLSINKDTAHLKQQQRNIILKLLSSSKDQDIKKQVLTQMQNIDNYKQGGLQLKLKYYLRIYGYNIQTINLCQQLLNNKKDNRYDQLLKKIKFLYSERVKKLKQFDYSEDNIMIIKNLRKELVKQENKANNQKQILRLYLELLGYIQQYEKQEYIIRIQALPIQRNQIEQIIYQIQKLSVSEKDGNEFDQKFHKIMKSIGIQHDKEDQLFLKKKLFKKLIYYEKYQKSVELGQQLLKTYKMIYQFEGDNIISEHKIQQIDYAKLYHQLSQIYYKIKKYEQALKYSYNSILIKKKYYDQMHPNLAISYHQISLILIRLGNYQQSLKYLQKCNSQNIEIASTYHQISERYLKLEKYQQARKCSQKCKSIQRKHLNVASYQQHLSQIKSKLN